MTLSEESKKNLINKAWKDPHFHKSQAGNFEIPENPIGKPKILESQLEMLGGLGVTDGCQPTVLECSASGCE
jgi:hypothetical protein